MLAIDENPPMMLPGASLAGMDGDWHAAHVKVHQEKKLAWSLFVMGSSFYLPMQRRVYHKNGRKFEFLDVIFPGYVFVCGADARDVAAHSGRAVQIIKVGYDRNRFITELSNIHTAIESGLPLAPCPFAAEGTLVRIAKGPLQGVQGRVVRQGSQSRLVLSVSMLGRNGVSLEVDENLLEAA
jgi:transcription antitermination factor NusG